MTFRSFIFCLVALICTVQAFMNAKNFLCFTSSAFKFKCSNTILCRRESAPLFLESFATELELQDPNTSELPDTFESSIVDMADDVTRALNEGIKNIRIDFDATLGDETYTSLQQALPMAQSLVSIIAPRLPENGTLRIFFPDAGGAAMVERDWKLGVNETLVLKNVEFSGIRRNSMLQKDFGCLIICPSNSDADNVLRVIEEIERTNQFVILINPALVNMDTTGYGLAGRKIRDLLLKSFTNVYYLRTLSWGAVIKRYGKMYSIWQQDDESKDGYRFLRNVEVKPNVDDLEEVYDEENGLSKNIDTPSFLNGIADFVRDFGRL